MSKKLVFKFIFLSFCLANLGLQNRFTTAVKAVQTEVPCLLYFEKARYQAHGH